MLPKTLYDKFKRQFPWFAETAEKYTANREDGGIDIYLKDGTILNFQFTDRNEWVLKRK